MIRSIRGQTSRLAGVLAPLVAVAMLAAFAPSASAEEKPFAWTLPATNLSDEGATLNAFVGSGGLETSYHFEYGTTGSYGSSAPAEPKSIGTEAFVEVGEEIEGLQAATTYHYRIVATNAEGTVYGEDEEFTTFTPFEGPVVVTKGQDPCAPVLATSTSVTGGCLLELEVHFDQTPLDAIDIDIELGGTKHEHARDCDSWMKVRVEGDGRFVMYDHGFTSHQDVICESEFQAACDFWSPETVGYEGQILSMGNGEYVADVYGYCVNFLTGGNVTNISPIRFGLTASEEVDSEEPWQFVATDLMVQDNPPTYLTGTWSTLPSPGVEIVPTQ